MLVAVLLLASASMHASDGSKERNPSQELQSKVKTLLDGYFEMSSNNQIKATVVFTINKEQELIVLAVDAKDRKFCEFVKSTLNYEAVNIEGVVEGRKYTLPITMSL